MGQQQLLLIILGAIIVGVAIAVGIALFESNQRARNQDAIMSETQDLISDIAAYSIRPRTMGGGGGDVSGYRIDPNGAWGTDNPDATFFTSFQTSNYVLVFGVSKTVSGAYVLSFFDRTGQILIGPVAVGFGS